MSETTEAMPAGVPVTTTAAPIPPLLHGATDFEILPGEFGEPWHATNGKIGVTVFASEANGDPSKRLFGSPALLYKQNEIRLPMGPKARVPHVHRTQILIAELNGTFVHLIERDGKVSIVVADRRLGR